MLEALQQEATRLCISVTSIMFTSGGKVKGCATRNSPVPCKLPQNARCFGAWKQLGEKVDICSDELSTGELS